MPPLISCQVRRDIPAKEDFLKSVRRLWKGSHLEKGRHRGLTDVQLRGGGGVYPREGEEAPLRAHAAVLHMCSSLLSEAMADVSVQGAHVIVMPDFNRNSVEAMLQLIYTGECSVSIGNMEELYQLLGIVIDKWNMKLHSSVYEGPALTSAQHTTPSQHTTLIFLDSEEDGVCDKRSEQGLKAKEKEHFLGGDPVSDESDQEEEYPLTEEWPADESDKELPDTGISGTLAATQSKDPSSKRNTKCPKCPSTFAVPSQLRHHLAVKHYRKKIRAKCSISNSTRECPICLTSFASNLCLVSHLAFKHNALSEVEVIKQFQVRAEEGEHPSREERPADESRQELPEIQVSCSKEDPTCPMCSKAVVYISHVSRR